MAEKNGKNEQEIARVSVSMSQEEHELLKRAAEADGGRSVSSFIRAHVLPAAERMVQSKVLEAA